MKRREFLISSASLAGVGIPLIGNAASKPCPPPTLAVAGGTSGTGSCAAGSRGLPDQYQVWDGLAGPNNSYFSGISRLRWVNPGVGDWLDTNLIPQGSTPIASVTLETVGQKSLTVTSPVARWVSGSSPNRGFMLRGTAGEWAVFAGRLNTDGAARPRLSVTTSAGSFSCPCTASAHWIHASFSAQNGQDTIQVSGDRSAILQFDLSSVTGTVTSATLQVTCKDRWNASVAFGVFEANTPAYRLGGNFETTGVAQAYANDVGIAAHPSVVWTCQDWSTGNFGGWDSAGPTGLGEAAGTDAATGIKYLRMVVPQGELNGITLKKFFMRGSKTYSAPSSVVDAMYMRYRLYIEDDWRSTMDNTKAPGPNLQLGWWNEGSGGYWQPLTGNGGDRGDGRKIVQGTGYGYNGHSMRGHLGGMVTTDANPYNELSWLGSYAYNLDQVDTFGDSIRWGNVVLTRGRWYNIEQFVQMNTLTGSADALGNREANFDGVFRSWVDGQLAYEKTNFRWRRHPEMGIAGFTMEMYHGGTVPTDVRMHCRWANFVASKQYIGPVREVAA